MSFWCVFVCGIVWVSNFSLFLYSAIFSPSNFLSLFQHSRLLKGHPVPENVAQPLLPPYPSPLPTVSWQDLQIFELTSLRASIHLTLYLPSNYLYLILSLSLSLLSSPTLTQSTCLSSAPGFIRRTSLFYPFLLLLSFWFPVNK